MPVRGPLRRSVMLIAMLVAGMAGIPAATAAPAWVPGTVFVAVDNGSYKVYDHNGNLTETISDGLGGTTTGCAFNPDLTKLYTTNWTLDKVEVYDDATHNLIQTIDTGGVRNESVVFAADGSFYVSHVGGGGIKHYNAGGTLLQTLASGQRTDWMDLAADQRTMFYSDEGPTIHRWDVQANVPLPDFATLPSGEGFALRLLPTADGSSDLLVADFDDVLRLDSAGNIVQTYNSPVPESTWFAVNLDPNGTSFWSGAPGSGNLYRFNLASGNVELGPINTGPGTPAGICLKGEPTAATSADVSITKADTPDPVSVGGVLTYTLGVSNAGPNDATGVSVTDQLPAGTTFISATSTQGSCGLAVGTVTCSPGTGANGGSATITIKVVPTTKTTLSNVAHVQATEADPNPADNSATATTRALKVTGSAFGEQVRSLLINSGPLPLVSRSVPGSNSDSVASVNVAGLLSTGVLTVNTQVGNDATVTSSADTANANLLAGLVGADTIHAVCSATATGASASTTIARLTVAGQTFTNLTPAPNTGIDIPGVGVVLLNEQVHPSPGTITVNALHLHVTAGTDIIISQAHCDVDP